MGKVAIVGVEGSGKTVLMGALCECYKQGSEDIPYLMPENQAAFMFMERIPHRMRVERERPAATSVDALRTLRWTLRLGAEVLEEIEMLDYPGELYRIAFGERTKEEADAHRTELNEFLEHVTGADTLIVLLNLGDVQNLGANARNAETVWITRGIFDFAKKLIGLKHRALVFTQADRFAATLETCGGAEGVYAKRLPMLKTLHPDLRVIAVSAVSGMDSDGRPKTDYSTAGSLELMREILAELDKGTVRCLELCESSLAKVNEFSSGSPEDLSALVTTYSNAVADFVKASKPLAQVYEKRVEWHQTKVSNLSQMMSGILSLCSGASADVLANRMTWSGLRETYEAYGSIFDAFLKHYKAEVKRLKQLALEEEENAKKRAVQEAKDKRNKIIGVVCFGVLIAGIIGLASYSDWSAKRNAWEKAKTEYETAVTEVALKVSGKASEAESRGLLGKYGGEKWKEAQRFAELGKALKQRDIDLGKSHFNTASALMKDLTSIVLAERTKEYTALALEEQRIKDEAVRVESEKRARELSAIRAQEQRSAEEQRKARELAEARARDRDRVATLFAEAREAKANGYWKRILYCMDEVLYSDNGNTEALALKLEAERNREPTLRIVVEADGREVDAEIWDGQMTRKSSVPFRLTKDKKYSFVISYSVPITPYWRRIYNNATLNILADWEGLRTERAELEGREINLSTAP